MQKTKLEILKETYDYYTEDTSRRAVRNGRCQYYYDGKMCAFSRCMIDPQHPIDHELNFIPTASISGANHDALLKEEYRGHENEFWRELQKFHDYDCHWSKVGITDEGQVYYDMLVNSYSK